MGETRPKLAPRNWKLDLSRALAAGLGSVLALGVSQWPSNAADAAWVGLAGALFGVVAVFATEYLIRLHLAVGRLHRVERALEAERESRIEERALRNRLLQVERRKVAIAEVDNEIWNGAFREMEKSGRILPYAAILARRQVTMKTRGLDIPLPPEESHSAEAA